MSNALPLPRGFFGPDVGVPDDARRHFIAQAEAALREVFALADGQRNAWIPVREKKSVAVFRNFSRSTNSSSAHRSNVSEVSCRAALQASLPEVARAYAAHDDALFRRLAKKLDPYVLDAAVLRTVIPRTAQAPFRYIGVKWFAVRTPAPLVAARDYCVLEVQDRVVDASGNEMYVRVLRSIATPECPSLEASHALVRGHVLAGAFYRADRAEPHVVRAHHVARIDPCGSFPAQWAYKTAEAQAVSAVVQLRRVLEKQQMSACTFVDRREWVPNRERSRCAVCSRSFNAFRPRHHCRCCGEVICGKCSVFRSIDVPGATLRNVRLCAVCHVSVQRGGRDGVCANRLSDDYDDLDDARSVGSAASSQTLAHNEMHMVDLSMLAGTSGPGTPSAYSSASSTASDLSFRSTASSRSVADRRTRGLSAQHAAFLRSGATGVYASSTPRSCYDAATPRTYIANNLTQGFSCTGSSGSVTPRSDVSSSSNSNNAVTPSAATQRMTSFKHHPLDLGYLRDSVASNNTAPAAVVTRTVPVDCDALELSAASTASAQSSSSSAAPFADDKELPSRSRAMTCQPHVLHETTERMSSLGVAPRRSVARPRRSDDTGARRPFFGSLFSRSAAVAGTTRTVEPSCAP